MESSTNELQELTKSQDIPPPLPPPPSNVSNKSPVGGSQCSRVRTMVWDHFTKMLKGDTTKLGVACNYCDTSYVCNMKTNGTKSMKYHIKKQFKKCSFKKTDKS
ncbi:hypothetical protein CIPAW_10G142300 [Carya illinoinensis]|uniref:BED-type domain-containing protein n=1 Tax=Carya illinoinensis TaxID=32201 RepID=A0A8T1PEC7_CARIL|nr:hypothetical protein CIPAW_10G142300 [Carya illinoinensis]